jgi:hypothetical protein
VFNRLLLANLILPAAFLLAGCGGNPQQEARESSNIKPLAVLYGRYINSHQGKPPPDEAAFKAFVKGLDANQLAASGAKDADSIFISARDKQPYVILYGNDVPNASMKAVVIAYEQQGVGGKRYIATSLAQVQEVDEAEFRQQVPAAK